MLLMNPKVGDVVKRNSTGERVKVVDVQPIGARIFYVLEDARDGVYAGLCQESDLRPIPPAEWRTS